MVDVAPVQMLPAEYVIEEVPVKAVPEGDGDPRERHVYGQPNSTRNQPDRSVPKTHADTIEDGKGKSIQKTRTLPS